MKRWLVSFILEKKINILPQIWARAEAEFEQIHVLRKISKGKFPCHNWQCLYPDKHWASQHLWASFLCFQEKMANSVIKPSKCSSVKCAHLPALWAGVAQCAVLVFSVVPLMKWNNVTFMIQATSKFLNRKPQCAIRLHCPADNTP